MQKFLWCLLLPLVLAQASSAASKSNVYVKENVGYLTLDNGFVKAQFNTSGSAWMTELFGDFQGQGQYGDNLLAANGLRLERENEDGSVTSAVQQSASRGSKTVINKSSGCVTVDFPEVYDDTNLPAVQEEWQFTLCKGDRSMRFTSSGQILPSMSTYKMRSIGHSLYARPASTTAFFDEGVVQIMSAEASYGSFGSTSKMARAYFMGGGGAVDIQRPGATGGELDQVVLLNLEKSVGAPYTSGFREILLGTYLDRDYWSSGSSQSDVQTVGQSGVSKWSREWLIAPNNRNFPSGSLPAGSVSNMDNDRDVEALMTGIYGSAVPCLCTYPNEVSRGTQVAQIATTLRNGKGRGYNHTYNYFDPDNFISLSAIMYSGDPYLQQQARSVIERTGKFMKQENGQLPHHFDGIMPYFVALSGETQTGPNMFWVKTALRYAAVSGDMAWLQSYMPTLRNASSFVFDLIDAEKNLLLAPGSLMIDVFIRNNYTTDSNAMVVGLLRDFADAERLVGQEDRAQELEGLAGKVTLAINQNLWADATAGADHFITQLNTDGSTRDFVDYDANLIAVANAVSDEARSRAIQKRVDAGQCSAASGGGAQFVSEVYYGPEDTTNGNIGDSWCAMGRIGLFDALGRKRFGSPADLQYVNSRIIAPLQQDLIANTWMHERYGCDGLQQENRTMYYFEYPSFAAMLMRDIRYGVDLSLSAIRIDPFGAPGTFEYHTGDINVVLEPSARTEISVPGAGLFNYALTKMQPSVAYEVSVPPTGCSTPWTTLRVQSDETGKLLFSAPRGLDCALTITKV